ncbi:uncharacterized protein LOC143275475 [Babylonia areolata]|uniref:uncharacterized protein LOC143275475 n=1 Tax=Babylonia areolata TaxID=304850 RepID=UPI003FD3EA91
MFRRRRKTAVLCVLGCVATVWCMMNFGTVLLSGQEEWGRAVSPHLHQHSPPSHPNMTSSARLPRRHHKGLQGTATMTSSIDGVMASRRDRMLQRCQTSRPSSSFNTSSPSRRSSHSSSTAVFLKNKVTIINRPNGFLHCPLTKAASTFWGRFTLTLNTSGPMRSPFTIALTGQPLRQDRFSDLPRSLQERLDFLNTSLKTIFVRDPYHRMFSAYVDKILGPNPYFWQEWGRGARRVMRAAIPPAPGGCYQNLTFSQVMALAAVSFHKNEMHFVPASVRCLPCHFRYDVIGKMETFPQDLDHVSRLMNLSLTSYFSGPQFRQDFARDAIEDSIYSPFRWLKPITLCISKHQMGLRIWRKLQIRGLVDRRIPFPFSSQEFQAVTAEQMVEAAMKAHRESRDREELSRQKREAFVEAYRSVDLTVLQKLRQVFMDDFLMFGYPPDPPDVFDRQGVLRVTGAFDWSVPWGGVSWLGWWGRWWK